MPFVGELIVFLAAAMTAGGNFLQAFLWQNYGIWREMYFGCSVLIFVMFLGLYATELRNQCFRINTTLAEGHSASDPRILNIEGATR